MTSLMTEPSYEPLGFTKTPFQSGEEDPKDFDVLKSNFFIFSSSLNNCIF